MCLVDRLKRKEESALQELMNEYGDYLIRTAYLLLKDHQTAEEAVQDTFITAFDKIEQLDEADKLKSWLTTIVLNRCRSQMRKWSWKNIFLNFDTVERIKEDEGAPSPEEELMDLVWNQNLSHAIQKLDYKYREVITLFYFNELKIPEIASYTNSKGNTVKSRLKRGRLLLKELLMEGEEGFNEREEKIQKSARS
ncbi:RNA polymerase sigma-70 factor, ECF subfamily [Ornithinibacillus halophilus]|uniref:RNA polymerase sigma-70 factor, ECF subfamily n=1 Tax=Ornithinibacillus halophilus TaxID=930117 RepID=A0A1M5F4J9_9BACI|nr:RNA polymerase sigma-70 factor, ECF subfamily [Ornithinibacillus halophilus]